jgi:vacuolar-type H+-ATPase subunit F/Vma7
MIKALRKLGIEGTDLIIIKSIYDKSIAIIILNGGKTENISPNVRNKTRMPILPTLIQYSPGIPSESHKARRRNKRNINR